MFFLVFSLRMLLKKNKERTQRVLTGTLLFWLFLQLKDFALYSPSVERYGYVYNLVVLTDMWAVQVCSFYLFELLSAGWLTLRRIVLLWSANLVITLAYVFSGNAVWVDVMLVYSLIYSVVFVVIVYFAVRRYNSYLRANYSDTTRKNVKWLKYTTVIFFHLSCRLVVDGCQRLLFVGCDLSAGITGIVDLYSLFRRDTGICAFLRQYQLAASVPAERA